MAQLVWEKEDWLIRMTFKVFLQRFVKKILLISRVDHSNGNFFDLTGSIAVTCDQ